MDKKSNKGCIKRKKACLDVRFCLHKQKNLGKMRFANNIITL